MDLRMRHWYVAIQYIRMLTVSLTDLLNHGSSDAPLVIHDETLNRRQQTMCEHIDAQDDADIGGAVHDREADFVVFVLEWGGSGK
jgi:hypothetical protein